MLTARSELAVVPSGEPVGCGHGASCGASGSGPPSATSTPTGLPRASPPTHRQVGFPTAASTGPTGPLRQSGPITADRPGELIENVDVDCEINVVASNVVIRNSRVHCDHGTPWLVVLRNDDGVTTLDHVSVERAGGQALVEKGVFQVGNGDVALLGSRIVGTQDGCLCASGQIVDSYIHLGAKIGDFHNDGIQSGGGDGLLIRNNTIMNPNADTSAIALFESFRAQHDVTVDGNLLVGGGYGIYAGDGVRKPAGIHIVNNVWSRRYFPTGGRFGPVTAWCGDCPGALWRGNHWESGEPIDP